MLRIKIHKENLTEVLTHKKIKRNFFFSYALLLKLFFFLSQKSKIIIKKFSFSQTFSLIEFSRFNNILFWKCFLIVCVLFFSIFLSFHFILFNFYRTYTQKIKKQKNQKFFSPICHWLEKVPQFFSYIRTTFSLLYI